MIKYRVGRKERTEQEKLENARVGYQAALLLKANETASAWTRFYAMLVANSIMIAAISQTLRTSSLGFRLLSVVFAVSGVILCVCWRFVMGRTSIYHHYWILSARELEYKHLRKPVETITRGSGIAKLSRGKSIRVDDGRGPECLKMNFWGERRITRICPIIIWCFIALYCLLLFVLLPIDAWLHPIFPREMEQLRDLAIRQEETITRLFRELESERRLLEYHQQPFWRKLFSRKALPPPEQIVDMETEDKE